MSLREWETWQPVVDALGACTPPGRSVSEFVGTISSGAFGGSYLADGDTNAWHDHARALAAHDESPHDALDEAMIAIAAVAGPEGLPVIIRAGATPGPDDLVEIVELPSNVAAGLGTPVEDLVLVDGARPAPYSLTPEPSAAAPAATADPEMVARVVRERLPNAQGVSEAALAQAEDRLGVPLPEEVRALYRNAGSGDLILRDEDEDEYDEDDESFYGFEIVPLDDERATYLPDQRFQSWRLDATTLVPRDPSDRVQAVIGTPLWFPIGHDWGGNYYAVDLTPGPSGHRGQIVFLDHESSAGAELVADSLAELLAGRQAPWEDDDDPDPRIAGLDQRDGVNPAVLVTPETEIINIGALPEPLDLTPALDHPGIRVLSAAGGDNGALADPLQATRFPALEYLALPPDDWRRLLAADAVPRTLKAAGFGLTDPKLEDAIEVGNRILALWNQPPITLTEIRRPAKPE